MPLHETQQQQAERALLVSVDTGEFDAEVSLDELCELAATAGAEVVGTAIQKKESPDKATCLGSGRAEELARDCAAQDIDLLIVDRELTPTQQRNLEDIFPCRVIDRTTLILDIFAGRARSAEGRLQVELAQLRYRLPRLAGQGTAHWASSSTVWRASAPCGGSAAARTACRPSLWSGTPTRANPPCSTT